MRGPGEFQSYLTEEKQIYHTSINYILVTQFMPKYRKLEESNLNRLPTSHSEINLPIIDLCSKGKTGIQFLIYTSHS